MKEEIEHNAVSSFPQIREKARPREIFEGSDVGISIARDETRNASNCVTILALSDWTSCPLISVAQQVRRPSRLSMDSVK